MNIKAGNIIQDYRWPEPVQIKLIENIGNYIRIVGATIHSHIHIDQLIEKEEFENLSIAIIDSNFNANPRHIFLNLEAKRYRFASLYDPLLAMNTSKVDPLPYLHPTHLVGPPPPGLIKGDELCRLDPCT